MLLVVPAVIRPTVTTEGSNTSIERVIIVCSACTISHATGIGSSARCGSLAWPPRPMTRIIIVSADAMIGPRRLLTQPLGSAEVMCRANAASTGDVGAVGARRHVEQALVEHEPGAVVALLAGLEHEQHPTGDLVAALAQQVGGARQHRGVGVVTAGVHAPLDVRGEVEPGVLGHRQGIHVAAQQHRRARLRPLEQRHDAARRLVGRDRQRQPLQRLQHPLTGDRQVVAQLGPLVQRAPQRDRVAEQILRVRLHRPDHRVDVVCQRRSHVRSSTHGRRSASVAVTAHCGVERRHRVVARPTPRHGNGDDHDDVRSEPRAAHQPRQHPEPPDRHDHAR